ncbi:xanthine dehydrogenase family protein molybdopterin-binding subunit [Achromobacter aloeverae]
MRNDPTSSPVDALPWLRQAYENGCFTADIHPAGCLHAAFVRAAHPHAEILDISRDVRDDPDVLAFWTANDLPAGIKPIPCIIPLDNRDGSPRADPPRTLMASAKCRYEGEILAMVVARSELAARRAAARCRVSYRLLPAVTDADEAAREGAPLVWNDIPDNLCFDWEMGSSAARDAALRGAAHIVRRRLRNNAIIISPMETRNAIAAFVEKSDSFVLVSATQGAHWTRDVIACDVLGWPASRLEVVTPRVGGSFGAKIFVYPEQVLVLLAAEHLQATVKWSATRTEGCLTDVRGRDNWTDATMALSADGRILAIAADTIANLGAQLSNYGPFSSTTCGAPLLCGPYAIETVHARVRGVLTHTAPLDSYRGAGRPEAHYVLERMIDEAARETGMDPVALRRRNLIDETRLPYTTATGIHIESGMFRANFQRALEEADHAGFAQRREESRARGLRRGIGMANFIETNGGFALAKILERNTGGLPRETARITFLPDAAIRLDVGTQSSGQGHRRAYSRVLADYLSLPAAAIQVAQGRSDRLRQGTGTGGSKSMLSGSTAILDAADETLAKARAWLAARTGISADDIVWRMGRLWMGDIALTLLDAAKMARSESGLQHPFDSHVTATVQSGTHGNGCHICEVEVDPATGRTSVVRYTAVSDFGHLLSPEGVMGQQYGGIAQGLGQALIEECRYDDRGKLASADFSSYHLPQAADMPDARLIFQNTPSGTNRLGLKGCGEAAASAAPPAIMNAVQHALHQESDGIIQMPATPEHVWNALHRRRAKQ